MITKETYEEMKRLITEYELNPICNLEDQQPPYIYVHAVDVEAKYNRLYGDEKVCKCGHSYYRHFDSYENMEAVGCKYCQCYRFTPPAHSHPSQIK